MQRVDSLGDYAGGGAAAALAVDGVWALRTDHPLAGPLRVVEHRQQEGLVGQGGGRACEVQYTVCLSRLKVFDLVGGNAGLEPPPRAPVRDAGREQRALCRRHESHRTVQALHFLRRPAAVVSEALQDLAEVAGLRGVLVLMSGRIVC